MCLHNNPPQTYGIKTEVSPAYHINEQDYYYLNSAVSLLFSKMKQMLPKRRNQIQRIGSMRANEMVTQMVLPLKRRDIIGGVLRTPFRFSCQDTNIVNRM